MSKDNLEGLGFSDAVRFHQNGKLNEAEVIYMRTLLQQLNHPDALHLMGVIAYQRYVLFAKRLAMDPESRRDFSNTIAQQRPKAHRDLACIQKLEEFLKKAVGDYSF